MIARGFCFLLPAALTVFRHASLLPADDTISPVRLLWAGSSSIYYHNQPKVCAHWLTEYCETPAISELVGKSGTGVHVYLRPGFVAQYGLTTGQTIVKRSPSRNTTSWCFRSRQSSSTALRVTSTIGRSMSIAGRFEMPAASQ